MSKTDLTLAEQTEQDRMIEELTALLLEEELGSSREASLDDNAETTTRNCKGPQPVPRDSPLGAAWVQERLWVGERREPGAWNMGGALELDGPLSLGALREALNALVARHEPLRTHFEWDEDSGSLCQRIDPEQSALMVEREADEKDVDRLVREHEEQRFDLEKGPLFRVLLLRLKPDKYVLSLAIHHIVADGWSFGVIVREVRALYAAATEGREAGLAPLLLQYADYAAWQQAQELSGSLNYWKQVLEAPPAPLDLLAGAGGVGSAGDAGSIERAMPERLARAVGQLAREQHASLFMVLLTGWALVALRRTGQEDLCLGTTAAGRDNAQVESLIGFFINVLPLRIDLSGDPSGIELLDRVRSTTLGALENQAVPFERLLAEIAGLRQAGGRTPVPVVMRHQNFGMPKLDYWADGISARHLPVHRKRNATGDLDLQYLGSESGLSVLAEYDQVRFSQVEVERLLDELDLLLERLAAEPHAPLSQLMRLSDRDREALPVLAGDRRHWNQASVIQLFVHQARQTPEALACQDEEQFLTFRELDRRSDLVSRALRTLGVDSKTGSDPGERVALYLQRGVDHLTALLGVWKAGGVYVPLDPGYPAEYAGRILNEIEPRVILTGNAGAPGFVSGQAALLGIKEAWQQSPYVEAEFDTSQDCEPKLDDVAYIAYTSGSTGEPKGVAVEHRQLINCLQSLWEAQPFDVDEVVVQRTGAAFVVSIKEMLAGLLQGRPTFFAGDLLVRDTPRFAQALQQYRVTRLNLVSSQLGALLDHAELLSTLRRVVVAGEPLPAALTHRFHRLLPEAKLYNNWGTSETNDLTYHHVVPAESAAGNDTEDTMESISPMGRPIPNVRMHLLDERMRPVPVATPGELYVEGDAVGRGYWRRPELTRHRFLTNPFATARDGAAEESTPPERTSLLFRTGDLARLSFDGELHYLGRRDFQVKIRGQKVDPLAVEQTLALHPGVERVAVRGWDEGTERALLAAYWIAREQPTSATLHSQTTGPEVDEADSEAGSFRAVAECADVDLKAKPLDGNHLHAWLAARLPAPMIPAAWIRLRELPALPNGKLDRGALPRPEATPPATAAELPENSTEQTLARAWARVLHLPPDQIRRDDNFFAIGGNSLLATQITQVLREEHGIVLDIKAIFETPVLRELALQLVEPSTPEQPTHSFAAILPLRTAGARPPLFCIHPIIGFGWGYASLLTSIDRDRPIYALQARGFGGEALPSSMDALLSDYLASIRAIQPQGPYYLCGWSFGGLVAYLLAARLEADGQTVPLLTLLDAYPPHLRQHLGESEDSELTSNPERFLGIWTTQSLLRFGFDPEAISKELTERIIAIMINSASLIDTRFTGTDEMPRLKGNMLLFRAIVDSFKMFEKMPPEVWSPYVAGNLLSVDVEASHMSMLEGIYGLEIGRVLETELALSDLSVGCHPHSSGSLSTETVALYR